MLSLYLNKKNAQRIQNSEGYVMIFNFSNDIYVYQRISNINNVVFNEKKYTIL